LLVSYHSAASGNSGPHGFSYPAASFSIKEPLRERRERKSEIPAGALRNLNYRPSDTEVKTNQEKFQG
jgi:hypothetical protein